MRNIADRRQVNVDLTAKGSALYPRITEIVAGVNRQFFDGFSPSEAGQLQDLLRRLFANRKSPSDANRTTCDSRYQLQVLSPHGISRTNGID
jgi:hypothetical protein